MVKSKRNFGDYLKSDDVKGRRLHTRLESGTNFLRIESGRREGLNTEERKCWFGCNATEDEEHFLLHCFMYDDLIEQVKESGRKEDGNTMDRDLPWPHSQIIKREST